MKRLHTLLAALAVTAAANAQIGAPYIHDPSTLAECDGKYYTFGAKVLGWAEALSARFQKRRCWQLLKSDF